MLRIVLAVWKWDIEADNTPDIPVTWRPEGELEDCFLNCDQEHGFHTGCLWRC